MRGLAFCIAVLLSGSLGAQLYLTGNANGQWMIYRSEQHIVLPTSVHYLGNFDESGLAIFAEYDRYGVMDRDGKIRRAAEFRELKALGNGFFSGMTAHGTVWMDLQNEEVEEQAFSHCEPITNHWYELIQEKDTLWLNTKGKREFHKSKGHILMKAGFGFLHMRAGLSHYLLDPQGDTIALGSSFPVFGPHYVLIDAPTYKAVVFKQRVIHIPLEASGLDFLENHITYSLGKEVYLLNGETGEVQLTVTGEALKLFDRDYYLLKKGAHWGLIRKNGETFLPPAYFAINLSGGFYRVTNREGSGLLDSLGRQVVPCKYASVSVQGDFFKVTSALDLCGLISRKNPALNLPCQYNQVFIGRNVIKAYTDDYLRIMHIDAAHQIEDNVLLENVIDVKMQHKHDQGKAIDHRLYDLGWFCEAVGQLDSEGFLVGERLKWGLMGAGDSLLLPARYKQPIYVPQAEFSLLSRGTKKHTFFGQLEEEIEQWALMSHQNGKPVTSELVVSVDTSDLFFRAYSRMYTLKGPAVLLPDNTVMFCDYIDPGPSELQRYCISPTHTIRLAKESDKESVGLPTWNQNDNPNLAVELKEWNKTSNFVKFPDARWNFLNPEGKPIFEEDFDYVQSFYRGTSIVKQNGRWGLVSQDTTLIPPAYSAISRVSELEDTVFLVRQTPKGIQLYDQAFQTLDPTVTRVLFSGEGLTMVECKGDKKVMDAAHQYVSDSSKYQKIISERYLLSKRRQEFVLRDLHGTLLGSFKLKPEAVLFDRYVLVENRGKYGVLDFFGDTLLDFHFTEIRQTGSFLICVDKLKNPVYNAAMNLLCNAKESRVLVDPVRDQLALVKNEKCKIYMPDGAVTAKVSGIDAHLFYNGWLMTVGVNARAVNTDKREFAFPGITRTIEGLDAHGFLVEELKGRYAYYDAAFNLLSDSLNLRHAEYVGAGCISALCDAKTVLITSKTIKWFPGGTHALGTFESGRLLLKQGDSQHFYVDEQLENPFRRIFTGAHPFSGEYASVEEGDGWTMIDREGARKSLGAYEELKPEGNGVFSTTRQSLFGLFDSHGKEILPVVFQEIHVLNPNLIQAIHEGQIEYYDRHGKALVPDLLTRELTSR